jgi:sigma-E factor negative regulatory protein RseA
MDNRELARERISAFADGECGDVEADIALAALHGKGEKADWEIYHQIGEVLRSDDMAVQMSPDFSARLAARLESEPIHMTPTSIRTRDASRKPAGGYKRWALPGIAAAAAAAAIAFVTTPQLMVAMKGHPTQEPVDAMVAASASEGVVLRDERIDDYLLAHQRFSPSVFSTAQYARTATFAADSNK